MAKTAKNYLKRAKSAFLGQNSVGGLREKWGDYPKFCLVDGESPQFPRNGKPCHMHPHLIFDGGILPRGHQEIVGVRAKNNANCAFKVFEIYLKLLYIIISFLLLGIHKFTILML